MEVPISQPAMANQIGIWLILAAPFVGSFLGVAATRLPEGGSVIFGRSRCDCCGHVLATVDLIPYLSWLRLHGKCRYCKQSFGAFYPLIELAALVIALWAATVTGGIVFAASCTLGWTLLALAISDWQTFLLPDPLVLFLLVAGFGATVLLSPAQFFQHLIGAFAGYIAFATLSWAYRRLRGRNGLGLGDAKLLAALGAWLSWSALPSVVFLAALAGLAMILARSLLGSRTILTDRISFGTFLAGAGWLVWLYGPLALG